MANIDDKVKAGSCPFCREPTAVNDHRKRLMKRVKANDPAALRNVGGTCYNKGGYDGAFEYWTKAAESGDADAHYGLGNMYRKGEGVEKDEEKAVYHYEKAAIGGHPGARYNLGGIEWTNGNVERAVKHYIIAANLGDEYSMRLLWKHYSAGNIAKEDLDATLRSHQAALNEMKSEQRDAAEASGAFSS
jgi:TPR repeat protein